MNVLDFPFSASVPWLLGAALCFAIAAATRPRAREVLALVALTGCTFAARAALVPPRFFHQNGQGPHQVERILHGVFFEYGPGIFELFHGATVRRPRDPEGAVFLVQSLLAALGPACAWLIARRAGAQRPLAAVLALGVALDPMLARLARSESYFGTGSSLLLLATAALSLRASRAPITSAPFLCASLAAGALVAQVARLHPLLWPAAALTPLVLLVGDGALRRRVRSTLAATAVIAVVVLPLAGPSMWTALHSELAARLSSQVSIAEHTLSRLAQLLFAGAVLFMLARRRKAALVPVTLGFLVGLVVHAANFPSSSGLAPWIEGGYLRVYAAAYVVVVVALLRGLTRTPQHAWALAALGALCVAVPIAARHRVDRLVPTDTLEAELARSWRGRIPSDAMVVWLGTAARGMLRLPLYPLADADGRDVRPTDIDGLARVANAPPPALWYYRSSLCSTPAGEAACADFERRVALQPVATWTLPAVESYTLRFVTRQVRVGLFRAEQPATR